MTFRYILCQPLLRIFIKSPTSALQSILHVLFLPTPFKSIPANNGGKPAAEEILKPGALYRECAVVRLQVPSVPDPQASGNGKGKEKVQEGEGLPDDVELGGEVAGRLVWEAFEKELVEWETANPPPPKREGADTPPEVDVPAIA